MPRATTIQGWCLALIILMAAINVFLFAYYGNVVSLIAAVFITGLGWSTWNTRQRTKALEAEAERWEW